MMSRHADRQQMALESGATAIVAERGEEGIAKVREILGGGADAALNVLEQKLLLTKPSACFIMAVVSVLSVCHTTTTTPLAQPLLKISLSVVALLLSQPIIRKFCSMPFSKATSTQVEFSPKLTVWTISTKPTKTWPTAKRLKL